jgi:hypothetical protein
MTFRTIKQHQLGVEESQNKRLLELVELEESLLWARQAIELAQACQKKSFDKKVKLQKF